MTYVYLMENTRPLNAEVVKLHVEHLTELDRQNKLVLCGPFMDYPGGMVAFIAESMEEAAELAQKDPFIALGYKTFSLRTLEVANAENGYLL